MATGLHWYMNFASKNGTKYRVNIYDGEWEDEYVELKGGSVPFITDEDDDESPFTAIRVQSGTLRIMAEEGIDTDALNPKDNKSHFVELVKPVGTRGWQVLWQGYMQPQTFSQPWGPKPYELEFPLISPLGLLETKEMDMDLGLGSVSLRDLLIEAFVQTDIDDLYNEIYVDHIMASPKLQDALSYKVSRYNWFEENQSEDDGTDSWKSKEGQTYYDLVEDIMKFMGVTLVEKGRTLYMKAPEAWTDTSNKKNTDCFKIDFTNFIQKTGSWTSDFAYSKTFANALSVASTSHTDERIPGKRKCTVVAQTNKIDEMLESMNPKAYEVIDTKKINRIVVDPSTGEPRPESSYVMSKLRAKTCLGNNITPHIYDYNTEEELDYPTQVDLSFYYGSTSESQEQEGQYMNYGTRIMDIDAYTQQDVDDGKENYSFDSGLLTRTYNLKVTTEPPTVTGNWDSNVAWQIGSSERAWFTNGYFCLSMLIQAYDKDMKRRCNGLGYISLGLRIGDKYWNGSSWQATPCRFYAKAGQKGAESWYDIGNGQLFSTKTLDMDCDASGYMIPINEIISGDIELRMFLDYRTIGNYPSYFLMVQDVSLEYLSPASIAYNSHTNNSYSKSTNKAFVDETTITLHIATDKNNKNGYAILKNGLNNVGTLQYKKQGGAEFLRPEEYLLGRMVNHYKESVRYLTVEVEKNDEITANTKLVDADDTIYYPLAESINWRDDTVELKLMEVKV